MRNHGNYGNPSTVEFITWLYLRRHALIGTYLHTSSRNRD